MTVSDAILQSLVGAALSGGSDRVKWTDELKSILENIIDSKINIALKGSLNGIAELDGSGKVPSAQLPSYVDDVIEVDDYVSLPVSGETGKIYVTKDTNHQYRWTGTIYVDISSGPGVAGLDDLTDVIITTPSIGDILMFDGTNWVNAVIPAGAYAISDLTDVLLTSLTAGNILIYDGTKWINSMELDPVFTAWLTTNPILTAVLTGFVSGAGTVTAADSVLSAFQKLDGNIAANTALISTIKTGNNIFNYYNFR